MNQHRTHHVILVLFCFLFSVTQMLTTQADRFSPEEVHCTPFTPIIILMSRVCVFVCVHRRDNLHHNNRVHPHQKHFIVNHHHAFLMHTEQCVVFVKGAKL